MEIVITILKTIGYILGASILTISFWFGLMWLVSRHEREPENIKKYHTPEEIEVYIEMSRKERRALAKARLKAYRKSKEWFHDEEAQRWIDENEKESA